MAASIERMPRFLEQPSAFAVEDCRFCTSLFEPSPNRCIVKHIQDLWDQVWQYSTTLIYQFLGDRIFAPV
jgi:hypothetical protein